MSCFPAWRRPLPWALIVIVAAHAPMTEAGPWSQLPDAVDRLRQDSNEEDAERVVRLAEASVVREAQVGNLAAARSLFDTYASLVSGLSDSGPRLARVERRLAQRLLEYGDSQRSTSLSDAAGAWSLAAEFDPDSAAVERLRSVFLPPVEAQPGQVWRSPVDGAALVFHPTTGARIGCTEGDGACQDNEIYFRWVEVPGLWVEAREVTNRRYRLCVVAGSCTPPEAVASFDDPARANHPVVGVSWPQARAFARWAGRRLPSEAEWERAARGEVNSARFPWGNSRRRELANVWADPRDGLTGGTRPVGGYPSTGYGLSDMAGNVWEWCQDRYQARFSDEIEGAGAAREGWGRVVRGGSWRRAIDMARVSTRLWYDLGYTADDVGFRCVMDHGRQVPAEALVRSVQRAFPVLVVSPHELDRAQLEAEDRRYLERRAITLFVIEGRMEDALVPAAVRLRHEARDPVALDLFNRFETELLRSAAGGGLDEVAGGLESFRLAVVENPDLGRRLETFERRVLAALRRTVEEREVRGDQAIAIEAALLALTIAPDDAIMEAAASRLSRKTGTTRVWPGDGKGMVWIRGTTFRCGASPGDNAANVSEQPAREVTLDGFWIDRTEVTNDEYRSCVEAGACTLPGRTEVFDSPNLGNHPVLWVDWFQARAYAAWAGKRMPSEAEWELAARAGSTAEFPWGAGWRPGMANALGTEDGDSWGGTAPVASFEPDRWGVYDLVGNAAEWVDDVFNETLFNAPRDGRPWYQETGLAGERRRVVRGGGYDDPPGRQRVSRRIGRKPDSFQRTVGFRCVADEDSH